MLKRRGAKTDPEERRFLDDEAALLVVTGTKSETSVSDKLHDQSDSVLIRQKPQQLADKTIVPESVICRFQFDKYGTGLLLSLKRILDVLGQQNNLILGCLPASRPSLLIRKQWINNWLHMGVNKSLENLVGDTEQSYWSITL